VFTTHGLPMAMCGDRLNLLVRNEAQAVWRRPPRDLASILGCRYRRVVALDNTVRLGLRLVPLPASAPTPRSPSKCGSSLMVASSSYTMM
jgi:hypothetical protein